LTGLSTLYRIFFLLLAETGLFCVQTSAPLVFNFRPHVTIITCAVNLFRAICCIVRSKLRESVRSHVARLLREERENRGLSLNLLAEKAGLSRQMVSYVEQEKRNPSLDILLRITEVLEIKLEDVLVRARAAAKR
jgi:DNA-binding XRE family transcriptional regulator